MGIFGSSLQSVHVYTLAQVLRRPILVLGYDDLDTRDSDDSLAGLFLPTRWDPRECFRQPLVLGAMLGHFFAVAPFDTTTHIPLCRSDGTPVTLRYEDPKLTSTELPVLPDIVHKYMDVDTLEGRFMAARVANRNDPSNRLSQTEEMWRAYVESAWALFSSLDH